MSCRIQESEAWSRLLVPNVLEYFKFSDDDGIRIEHWHKPLVSLCDRLLQCKQRLQSLSLNFDVQALDHQVIESLSEFQQLIHLELDDTSRHHASDSMPIKITGLLRLESLVYSMRFAQGPCQIRNCPKLQSLTLGAEIPEGIDK